MNPPRIIISAMRGGSGKTILSLGIIAALKLAGKAPAPFKKGPDYIDAGWLALVAGRPCYNLDTYLVKQQHILHSFITHSLHCDIAVIEGNRGLYDGIDALGITSTAEVAKLLHSPVILCMDCTKTTRTVAASVLGCTVFDPDVDIKGVILNRVAGPRHENILRISIEQHCGIPVLGSVPKLKNERFPERHMGLVPTVEHDWALKAIDFAADIANKYLDLDRLSKIAQASKENPPLFNVPIDSGPTEADKSKCASSPNDLKPRIGIIKDSAFQFYYPDNLEALEANGAELVYTSALSDKSMPPVDALYIGGGFPETHAGQLAENKNFRNEIYRLGKTGLPIYAECGGLMYLGKELVLGDQAYPMVGLLPIVFGFSKKPQGHGYTHLIVKKDNPYFKKGVELCGHEFHYSTVLKWEGNDDDMVFQMKRGTGFQNGMDGICYQNVFATYSHIHALGTPGWARAIIQNAIDYKKRAAT